MRHSFVLISFIIINHTPLARSAAFGTIPEVLKTFCHVLFFPVLISRHRSEAQPMKGFKVLGKHSLLHLAVCIWRIPSLHQDIGKPTLSGRLNLI